MTKMLLKSILSVVLITSLSQQIMAQNKSFCQSFADNGFKIDHNFNAGRTALVIGSDYWWTFEEYSGDYSGQLIQSLKSFSERSDVFDNRYNALIFWYIRGIDVSDAQTDETILLIGGLYANNTIQWIPIDTKRREINKRDDIKGLKNTRMDFEPDFKPTIGFMFQLPNEQGYLPTARCFLQQTRLTWNDFLRRFRCFQFNGTKDGVISYRDLTDDELRDSGLGLKYSKVNTIGHGKVIAVSPKGFLFNENKIITYCETKSGPFNDGCKQTKVMINCSQFLQTLSTTTQSTTITESSTESTLFPDKSETIWEWMAWNYQWILVVTTIIGVLLSAFCVLYFYCYSEANIFVGEDEEQSIGNQTTTSKSPKCCTKVNVEIDDKII